MRYFDTHAHLTDERFDSDRDALVAALPGRGVALTLDVGCDLRDVSATLALAGAHDHIYAALGMHPHEAAHMTDRMLEQLREQLTLPKVAALGEIGLDYHYDFSPRDVQRKWFLRQLDLAVELDVPVCLHVREAFGDCMDILKDYRGRLRGVMHCFSGSVETAFACVDLGLYVALGGAVTFKNARKLLDVARLLPLDKLLAETDCPYLTPEPHRGRRNEPAFVRHVVARIAALRDEDEAAVAQALFENGLKCFDIPELP